MLKSNFLVKVLLEIYYSEIEASDRCPVTTNAPEIRRGRTFFNMEGKCYKLQQQSYFKSEHFLGLGEA